MSSFPANIDLSSLDGSDGFKLSGVAPDDYSGRSVASAGDVNGDGFADLIIGTPGADPHGGFSGASYVVFGKASGFGANFDLSTLDGTNGFKLSGVAAGYGTGFSVASAGDVDGDGFDDVIVGATGADGGAGASYVVFGKASGFGANLDLSTLDGNDGFRLGGVAADDFSGVSVASAGDVNGDGFADLVVGALFADPHGSSSGASYLVFGKASGFAANFDLSSLDGSNGVKLSGPAANSNSGATVASAGDVNGDGFADLIISAPYPGAAYVVFGKASGFAANLDLSSLDGSNGFKLGGLATSRIGTSVASAGDVNGDGFADLIVGADRADPHGIDSGASYVVFGKASGFAATLDVSSLNGSNGFKISGVAAGDYSGRSVASAGDVNKDGFADLIIGAEGADPDGSGSGASYVVFGKASGFGANLDLSTLDGGNGFKLSGFAGALSGRSIASAGDVDGDGFDDLIVGAFGADGAAGASYVVFGHAVDAFDLVGTNGPDTLTGTNADNTLRGLGGDDTLSGLDGNDVLDGGTGVDTMAGGAGGDTYYVDNLLDVVTEAIGGGGDTVFSTVNYTLAAGSEIEFLTANAGNTGLTLAGNAFNNMISGAAGDDILSGGAGSDQLFGNDGNDILVVSNGDVAIGEIYDGGAGSDTLRFDDATVADFTSTTVTAVEHVVGSSGGDSLSFTLGQFESFSTFDGGAGNDAVTVTLRGPLDVSASPGPTIANLESLQLLGSSGNDIATLSAQQVAAFDKINLAGGTDTLNIVVNGTADFTTAFPAVPGVEQLNLQGTGSVRLTVAVLDKFSAIAAGLDVTLADTASHLQGLTPSKIALLAGKGVDRLDSTTDSLNLTVAQYQALGTVALTASDTVRLTDSGAALAALTPSNIALLASKGVDRLDSTTNSLLLTVAQYQALGTVALTASDTVRLTDSGAALAALTPSQIGGLAAKGIDWLDATDDALTLNAAQAKALNGVMAANLDLVTVADTGDQLAGLSAADITALNAAHIDRLDATTDRLTLSVAQFLALGLITLTPADDAILTDTGAALASLSASRIATLAGKGFDQINATDDILTLSVAQATALGGLVIGTGDLATVTDTGSRLASLSAAEIAAFDAAQIDRLDASDNALSWTIDQFDALGRVTLAADDVLTLAGSAGDDDIDFNRQPFNIADRIDGGAGNDVLWLVGDYSSLAFQATTVTGIEKLLFGAGHDYGLTLADANVAAGQQLIVNAGNLDVLDSFTFDGSAETNGTFRVVGGDAAISVTGGNGADTMRLGTGADLVRYGAASQSTSAGYDTIAGFDAAADHLHVWTGVTAVDAPITTGTLSKGSFDGDLAAAMAGLVAHHAALFTADAGGFAGWQFLVVDTNGTAGYQAGADLVVRLDDATHLDQFNAATFV
jgi:Ca2+-binding RTX toxin-like protein